MRVGGRGDERVRQQGPSSKWPRASSRSYKTLEDSEDDENSYPVVVREDAGGRSATSSSATVTSVGEIFYGASEALEKARVTDDR